MTNLENVRPKTVDIDRLAVRIFSKLYCWCRQQNYTSINLEKSIRKLNMQFSYVFAMCLTLPLSKVSEMVVYFHWPSSIDPNRRFWCSFILAL